MKSLRTISALGAAFVLMGGLATAQEKKLRCQERNGDSRPSACYMKEQTLTPTSKLDVSAAPNGGISVTGWDQGQILVRARVEARGDNDADAESTMKQVILHMEPGRVWADGPKSMTGNRSWSVSYEVFVPRRMDLALKSVNGGVNVADVTGAIEAQTVNGGLNLAGLSGKVSGHTTNGGVNLRLTGSAWEGDGCDVKTTNGGVNVEVPASYSARFEARTVNGGLKSDLPNSTVQGKQWGPRTLQTTSGSGGSLVKIETTNGGVNIRNKS